MTLTKNTNTKSKATENKSDSSAPKPRKSHSKLIALVEGLVIYSAILLSLGGFLGFRYAHNQTETVKQAVLSATTDRDNDSLKK
jgi:hypothetical protein